jgi:hypothetical protein
MKNKKQIVTAVVVAGSMGFGAQAIFAQGTGSRPLENPTSQGQFEEKGTQQKRSSDSGVSSSQEPGTSGATQRGGAAAQGGTKTGKETGSRPVERGASESQFEEKSASKPGRASNISEADVQNIKTALKAKGLKPGPMNGELDSQTQQAIREFQQKNNLKVTGDVDEQTAAKLGVTIGKAGSSRSSAGSAAGTGSSGKSSSMERDSSGGSSDKNR